MAEKTIQKKENFLNYIGYWHVCDCPVNVKVFWKTLPTVDDAIH